MGGTPAPVGPEAFLFASHGCRGAVAAQQQEELSLRWAVWGPRRPRGHGHADAEESVFAPRLNCAR